MEREARIRQALSENTPDLAAERLGHIGAGAGEHDNELVAAEPRCLGSIREGPTEHIGNLAKEGVSELVPGAVVDLLEVVAIDDQEAERNTLFLRGSKCLSRRSSKPRRLRIPVSGSVTAL